MQWFSQAPSNVALIKYMGKADVEQNLPANASLSYTLPSLITNVMLESYPGKKDIWEPLEIPGADPFALSVTGQQRFINHLARVKNHFNYKGNFIIRSSNNFPHATGLASSASSFAALTKCACIALTELTGKAYPSRETQATLSRLGSGSSCRSFYGPWALWDGDSVKEIELPYPKLMHQVVLVSHDEKKVPSSTAHQWIETSPNFKGRVQRAKNNLKLLIEALNNKEWEAAYKICWNEFQDMHQLFETAEPPFKYITDESSEVLIAVQQLWKKHGDGPLVTMDAGPNIHLLYRPDQLSLAMHFKDDHLIGNFDVLGF